MDIAFNINPLGMEGLGATISSLVRSCSNTTSLNLWFLCSDLMKSDKTNIGVLLEQEKFMGKIQFIDFDSKKHFGHLRSLHGDWTTYGRLLIPKLIPSDSVLYLDADLIILADVLDLEGINFHEHVLAAVYGAPVEATLDKDFLMNKLKWNSDISYFNAGILMFNVKKWNELNFDEKIENMGKKYSNDFLSSDQTLLDAVCGGKFDELPLEFNIPWFPGAKRPLNSDTAILHFVGSPKPWDLMGKIVHKGYDVWAVYHTSFWKKHYGKFTPDKLYRFWKIRRSMFKHLKNKLSNY